MTKSVVKLAESAHGTLTDLPNAEGLLLVGTDLFWRAAIVRRPSQASGSNAAWSTGAPPAAARGMRETALDVERLLGRQRTACAVEFLEHPMPRCHAFSATRAV